MRKHTKRVKYYRKKGSKKLRGGFNPITTLFGFGRPAVTPNDAQALQVAKVEAAELAGHQKEAESKQQQARDLINQCQDYEARVNELNANADLHNAQIEEITRSRASKNRCDEEHRDRLSQIKQNFQQRLADLTQQHNEELAAEERQAYAQHNACLTEGMRLVSRGQDMAQNPEPQNAAAAAAIQAQGRGQLGRRQAEDALRAQNEPAGVDHLGRLQVRGGRKSRRGGTGCGSHKKKKMYAGRKSRRGGTGCGSHKKKMMYAGRKSRRGGTGCGSHKKKMMYAGRKSRRGGARCSPKLKKKCPYYKKYGNHM